MLSFAVIAMLFSVSCKNKSNTNKEKINMETNQNVPLSEVSFGVRGNCMMCKKTIEKSVNSVSGVSNANWNVETKIMQVSFDATKTDKIALYEAIAASGYDTKTVIGDIESYNNLPACCQYDRNMLIN